MLFGKYRNYLTSAVLINRNTILEAFSFASWQRLHDLGLNEEGIEAKRIELHHKLLSDMVDPDEFTQLLVELGIAILKVKVTRNKGYARHQQIAMAGPAEAFNQLDAWWEGQTGRGCPLYQHLEWHHANSPLVKDRWQEAVANRQPFAIGAFSEMGARL